MRSPLLRLEELQRRHPWLGFPVAVVYKFIDDHGVYLSVLITYYGFLALFPLILLLTSILGFVLDDAPELRERILETAVSQFPVIGAQIGDEGFGGSTTAVVIGGIVAVWGAIRASQATLHMMNICWSVPALVLAFSFLVAVLVFSLGMWLGTSYPVRFTEVLPGALVAAGGWLLLQRFGITYANQIVSRAGDTYGVFAFVLGLIGFVFVAAQIVVLAVEVNVVRVKRLWPRSLLAPFTSSVPLTPADVRTYSEASAATAIKDFQEVEVTFGQPDVDQPDVNLDVDQPDVDPPDVNLDVDQPDVDQPDGPASR